jgi:hypothetical protein
MKTQSASLLLASGLVLGILPSCVDTYASHGQASVTTTSYHQPGYRINALPRGYRSEMISGSNYYYHNGAYYRRQSNGYVVVEAPRTSRYYSEYDRIRVGGNYRTSDNHRGQRNESVRVITRLPAGYRVVNHGGSQYYQAGGNYYRRQGSGYIIVSSPY